MPLDNDNKPAIKIIIPARYKSTRFPGKPLADIAGKSMISRVWERCRKALPAHDIFVATDDQRIQEHCETLGINTILTPENCATGTDRVYFASKELDADIIINVQGDEPLISKQDIQQVIEASIENRNTIINAMCKITDENEFRSFSVPKVVTTPNNELLYMSRAAIPASKEDNFHGATKQVCIYAFTKEHLEKFHNSTSSKTPLEAVEDIEILRFLELGIKVKMIEVSSSSIAVDFPEDIEKVETALLNENI